MWDFYSNSLRKLLIIITENIPFGLNYSNDIRVLTLKIKDTILSVILSTPTFFFLPQSDNDKTNQFKKFPEKRVELLFDL